MPSEDLRAVAARLYELTGIECPPWIKTVRDLEIWASLQAKISKAAQSQRVGDLFKELDSPETRRQRELSRQEWKAESDAQFERAFEHQEKFQKAGAAAKKQIGAPTRQKIIHKYNALTAPKRDRAAIIATSLDLSAQHVRRVLKMAGLK